MSWIVQHLLRNRLHIKATADIDSDEFNNLLLVEKKISELYDKGLLSDRDIEVLDSATDGKSLKRMGGDLKSSRITVSRSLIEICDRVSYFLGGYFTDDGFIDQMAYYYKLSPTEVEKLRQHITGKFKHKLMKRSRNQ